MNTGKKIILSLLVAVVGFLAILHLINGRATPKAGSVEFSYYAAGTNTSVTCANGVSTTISATTSARTYLVLTDTSATGAGTGDVYINFASTATNDTGIYLNATTTSYQLGQSSLSYAGPITCYAPHGNAVVTLTTLP